MSAEGFDTLEYGREPRPVLRLAVIVVAVVAVLASVTSVAISHHRVVVKRQERASFDRLLTLATAGQASVERAISQDRDVTQVAEPQLDSSLTAPSVRATLYQQVTAAQTKSRDDIDSASRLLAATPADRRLRPARDAMLAYLSGWSAMFTPSAGGVSQDDLVSRQLAATSALEQAAPDPGRAAAAGDLFGEADD